MMLPSGVMALAAEYRLEQKERNIPRASPKDFRDGSSHARQLLFVHQSGRRKADLPELVL
jgi:hypothetical protein